MTDSQECGRPDAVSQDLTVRLRTGLQSGVAAGFRSLVGTGLLMAVSVLVLDGVSAWVAANYGSAIAAAVAVVFSGVTGVLFAVYVVTVRSAGRAIIVGNDRAQLGLLLVELMMSSVRATTDRNGRLVGADYLVTARQRVRAAVGPLYSTIQGNLVTRAATRMVLRLSGRLVGEKVVDLLLAHDGDVDATSRELAASADTWLNSMVARWMRTQTLLACGLAVGISLVATAVLSTA